MLSRYASKQNRYRPLCAPKIYKELKPRRCKVANVALELSRQRMRKKVIDRFKHVRTCVLARELCLLVRANRVVLNKEDVRECCSFISKLCKEVGCEEASDLCAKAAEAVMESEEKYLELCAQSCKKCGEARRPSKPRRPEPERRVYVA